MIHPFSSLIGCLTCHEDVRAIYWPVSMYVVSLNCSECETEFVEFDTMRN